jgi:hypothetical protein
MTDRSIDSEDQPGEPPGVRLDEQAGSIGIVADGWWCLADTASYYPEDLPADWQLGYFANEQEGVYIDLAHWRTRLAESLHNWAADVHRGFRFYLEHPTVTDPAVHPGTGLGTHLGGFIRWSDAGTGRVLTPVDPDADQGPLRETAAVLRCPPELRGDLRAAAAWLRSIASQHQAALVVLPTPSSSQLADWKDLRALLGIGAWPASSPASS